ncbi:DUF2892 domain-containing protein [Leeuwenhoekiella sp. MAR_2009_132]
MDHGPFLLVLLILADILLVTRFFSICPVYIPFRINTKNKNRF